MLRVSLAVAWFFHGQALWCLRQAWGILVQDFLPQAFTCLGCLHFSVGTSGIATHWYPCKVQAGRNYRHWLLDYVSNLLCQSLDPLHLDSSTFLQSCARLDVFLPALCWSHFEPTLLLRSPTWLDLTLFLTGSGGPSATLSAGLGTS